MHKLLIGLVAGAIGVAVLVLDPFLPGWAFQFGEPEMRAAVEGTWKLTLDHGRAATFTLREASAPTQHAARSLVRPAAACGHRTLVRSAEACMDLSEMTLEVKMIASTLPDEEPRGRLLVAGLSFNGGELDLSLGGESIHARLAPDGTIRSIDGTVTPTARLERIAKSLQR
jgi:hypothetical protein